MADGTIKMLSYEEVMAIAGEIDDEADEMRQIVLRYYQHITEMLEKYQSRAAAAVQGAFVELHDKFDQYHTTVQAIAEVSRTSAATNEDTDEDAESTFLNAVHTAGN